ncbi:unnamed protein product [Trichogramma brassicae]|uniref:Uncharacterized protein n=1 Tax=Trichogramma brassicae TaxID=86971 RepID=A0A6H5I2B5_9HYME|nr:unnamed protein product [Trichogramma brassicae]
MYSRRIVKNPSSRSALVKALRVETKRLKIDLLRLFIKAYPSKTQTTYTIWLPMYASVCARLCLHTWCTYARRATLGLESKDKRLPLKETLRAAVAVAAEAEAATRRELGRNVSSSGSRNLLEGGLEGYCACGASCYQTISAAASSRALCSPRFEPASGDAAAVGVPPGPPAEHPLARAGPSRPNGEGDQRRPYSSSRDRDRDGPGRARERDQQQPYCRTEGNTRKSQESKAIVLKHTAHIIYTSFWKDFNPKSKITSDTELYKCLLLKRRLLPQEKKEILCAAAAVVAAATATRPHNMSRGSWRRATYIRETITADGTEERRTIAEIIGITILDSIHTHVLAIICPRAGHGTVKPAEGCCNSSLTIRSMSSRVLSIHSSS